MSDHWEASRGREHLTNDELGEEMSLVTRDRFSLSAHKTLSPGAKALGLFVLLVEGESLDSGSSLEKQKEKKNT
jgi:hypothetical protein